MSFGDVLGIIALVFSVAIAIFPNALNPIRERLARWHRDRKFTGAKRQLRTTRREIAQLKRSRSSQYRIEYLASLNFYTMCFLGAAIALILAISFEQSMQYHEASRRNAQNLSLLTAFVFYLLAIFGRIARTRSSYRQKLQKLQDKRKNLNFEVKKNA